MLVSPLPAPIGRLYRPGWALADKAARRRDQSSAHRFLHQRDDLGLFGGGQLLQGEGDRPQGAFVEVAASLKPSVAYLVLNFCALWKKQTIFPSLA